MTQHAQTWSAAAQATQPIMSAFPNGILGGTVPYETAVLIGSASDTMKGRMVEHKEAQDLLLHMHRQRQVQRASQGLSSNMLRAGSRPATMYHPTNQAHSTAGGPGYRHSAGQSISGKGTRGPRGPYMCGDCQVPKAGHVCPYEARQSGRGSGVKRSQYTKASEDGDTEMITGEAGPKPCDWHDFSKMHYLGMLAPTIKPEWLHVSRTSSLACQVWEFIGQHGHMDFDMLWEGRPGADGVSAVCNALVGEDDVSDGSLANLHSDAQDLVLTTEEPANALFVIQGLPVLNVIVYNLLKAGWICISALLRRKPGATITSGKALALDKIEFRLAIFLQQSALDYCDDPYLVKRRKGYPGQLDRDLSALISHLASQSLNGLDVCRWGNGSLTNPIYDDPKWDQSEGGYGSTAKISLTDLYEKCRPPVDAPTMDPPIGFEGKLAHFQKQTLQWMYTVETKEPQLEQEVHPLWRPLALAPGSQVPWIYVNLMSNTATVQRFPPVVPEPGGVLASDSGLGKSVMFLALVMANQRKTDSRDRSRSRQLIGEMKPSLQPLTAKTTLVITASEYISKWESQIEKFCPQLTYSVYYGMENNDHVTATALSRRDVVITSFKSLRCDLRQSSETHVSPLLGLQFWRVALDEPQTQGLPLHKVSEMAGELWRVNGWYLTGDLIQTSLKDIHGPLCFLDSDPYADLVVLQEVLLRPYAAGQHHAQAALPAMLKKLVWKHCYRHVDQELQQRPDIKRTNPLPASAPPVNRASLVEDDAMEESYDITPQTPYGGRKSQMRAAEEDRANRRRSNQYSAVKRVTKRKHDNGYRTCRTRYKDQREHWCNACRIKKACTNLQPMIED